MKILEITPTWPTTTFLTRHIFLLQHLSVQVGVVSAGGQDLSNVFETDQNMNILQLYFGTHVDRIKGFLKALRYKPNKVKLSIRERALLDIIQQNKPDILHFHFGYQAFILQPIAIELGIPFTVSLRGPEVQMVAFTDKIYRKKFCKLLQQAAAIHTVCDELGIKAMDMCQSRLPLFTIRTSIPIPHEFEKTASHTQSLITVGRLYWKKGFHDLIRAMQYIPDVSLNIVGDGEERPHLTHLIQSLGLQDRVYLLGKLPYDEFEILVRQSTAYVQSSLEEGFSNSLAEAMALGKPVFVTNVGGTGELIKEGENGIYIPMGDPIGMAKQFELLFDIPLMQRLGLAARETAEYEFTDEKHVQKFVRFYEYVFQKATY